MSFKFEKLEVWQSALNFANDVHLLTRSFPKEEMFSLSSQFKRAADSISLNIAEGSTGLSDAEQRRFISYAIRSITECVNCLHLSRARQYITEEIFNSFYQRAELLFKRINRFKNTLG
ncbi:MAG: four helix bundle protein [Citrobacter freundii]|nr:MAG: four helix bundle protein [Citrobacter freundii]